MPSVELRLLRVEATLDAGAYKTGADQKTAADDKMVASGKRLTDTLETTDRRLSQTGGSYERLARSLDPAYAAQQRFEAGSRTLQRALDTGKVSVERHAELVELLRQRYVAVPTQLRLVSDAVNDNTRAFALNRTGLSELRAAGVNAFQALAAGMSPLRVATTEGAQAFGAFAQGGLGFSGILRALVSPIGLAASGALALAGGIALVTSRALDNSAQPRPFNVIPPGPR